MIYVRKLDEREYLDLRRIKQKEIGRISQRAQIILLSAQEWAVPQIANLLELSQTTVRSWIRKFEAEGPEGLYDGRRSGRPRKQVERLMSRLR